MSSNKDKYKPFNWTIMHHDQIPSMVDACERHLLELKERLIYGEDSEETVNEHLAALACDAMIIFYILYGNGEHRNI